MTRNLSSPLLKGISDLLDNFTTLCRRNVSIPVSRQALNKLEESPSQDNLKNALDHGFELGVNNDCSQCIESGGACGYSQNSRSFICYCVDKPHSRTCRDTGEISFVQSHLLMFCHSIHLCSPSSTTHLLIGFSSHS